METIIFNVWRLLLLLVQIGFSILVGRERGIYIKISFLFKGECILVRKNGMFSQSAELFSKFDVSD